MKTLFPLFVVCGVFSEQSIISSIIIFWNVLVSEKDKKAKKNIRNINV